jgi:hypothetical protein
MAEQAAATVAVSDTQRPKVIYIMGAGHSGSTILGVTLGNCDSVFYAGEVEEWLANSGSPYLGGSERVRFWRGVSEQVDGTDLFGARVNRYLERSSALLQLHKWPTRRRLRPRYRRVAEDLFCAIARHAGATHIVDSSHFPLRAQELQALAGVDLYLVFLVRDPQRIVASELRNVSRHDVVERRLRALRVNLALWLTNLLAVVTFLRQPRERRLLVRHEDFVADPREVMRQILDTAQSLAGAPDMTALKTGVPLIGSKLIRSEMVALNTHAEAPVPRSAVTTALQLPWAILLPLLRPAASRPRNNSFGGER